MNIANKRIQNNKPFEINLNIFVNKDQNNNPPTPRSNNYNYRTVSSINPQTNHIHPINNLSIPSATNNRQYLYPMSPHQQQYIVFPTPVTQMQYLSPRSVSPNNLLFNARRRNPYQFNPILQNNSPQPFNKNIMFQQFKRNDISKEQILQRKKSDKQSQIDMLSSKKLKQEEQFIQSNNINELKVVSSVYQKQKRQNQLNDKKNILYQIFKQDQIFCPICQKGLLFQERQQHIQFHKNKMHSKSIINIPQLKQRKIDKQPSTDLFQLILNYVSSQNINQKSTKLKNEKQNKNLLQNDLVKSTQIKEIQKNQHQTNLSQFQQFGKTRKLHLTKPQNILASRQQSIQSNRDSRIKQQDIMMPVSMKKASPQKQTVSPRINQIKQIDQSQCFSHQNQQNKQQMVELSSFVINNHCEYQYQQKEYIKPNQVSSNQKDNQNIQGQINNSIVDMLDSSKTQKYQKPRRLPSNKQAFI